MRLRTRAGGYAHRAVRGIFCTAHRRLTHRGGIHASCARRARTRSSAITRGSAGIMARSRLASSAHLAHIVWHKQARGKRASNILYQAHLLHARGAPLISAGAHMPHAHIGASPRGSACHSRSRERHHRIIARRISILRILRYRARRYRQRVRRRGTGARIVASLSAS